MKISYFVNASWYFELHWLERAEAAINNGHKVYLISTFPNKNIRKNIESKGICCLDIKLERFSSNPIKNLTTLYQLVKINRKIKSDLFHLITIKPIILGGIYARLLKTPFVVSFVGLGRIFQKHESILNRLKFKIVTNIYKIIFSGRNHKIIFEHENDFHLLDSYVKLKKENIYIIEGAGVNIDEYVYTKECLENTFSVLFAGRLLWSKGLGDLVKAVDILHKKNINIVLKVAGISDLEDPDAISLNQIHEWEKQGNIVWLGKVEDMYSLLKHSNLVALPTKYAEGVPRIIIEACSVGRACIVSDSGGCKSIINDGYNGYLINNATPEEIADKIIFLKDNPDIRERFGSTSSKIVKDRFNRDIVIKKTLSVYNQFSNQELK
ncbi:glycosyltransferase family 4 protein [Rosenbergiella sp. S61]|uniref:Glycosyltransferase family 4 protein n=1 Tax=Rosenbergiella gaditana TaxID=2726987 RepID=A0ABS5SY64_9GAMM|nr:glycosyltransferase family 4 protein [Rosenbergiella gaditana]MBT0725047.1 glycosyltransferase family 4 protein [Rosenbergiella gaditana]